MKINLDKYLGIHSQGYVIKTYSFKNNEPIIDTLIKGYASIKPEKMMMQEDSIFDIASLTKFMIAIIAYKAIEEEGRWVHKKIAKGQYDIVR